MTGAEVCFSKPQVPQASRHIQAHIFEEILVSLIPGLKKNK